MRPSASSKVIGDAASIHGIFLQIITIYSVIALAVHMFLDG
jgi:hypothetical protein